MAVSADVMILASGGNVPVCTPPPSRSYDTVSLPFLLDDTVPVHVFSSISPGGAKHHVMVNVVPFPHVAIRASISGTVLCN